ncbi:EPIDERMAL PATTERNING FACTOR-like protein 1 [Rhododendron vialii]|uniref:EPIDERMAL PATTERNING FACTOR-like protein 1 n=1 Tax=Rhododendron vialii TaxID=182163 RepID=UPI00265E3A61|nr:EPIDERMAL PATTERNING FACTOR-like protein 1 [Rhododendron vialii]
MAMNISALQLSLLRTTSTLIITLVIIIHLLPPVTCFTSPIQPPADTSRGSLLEGKTRLGSTPPSCHNKCNQCHPCFAVQVPTMPSHDRFQPGLTPTEFSDDSSPSSSSFTNKYTNYKPLGWKCRCRDHFFNP